MRRTALLILFLGMPAFGQARSSPPPTLIRFRTEWDAHNSLVRIRPDGDTSAAWAFRTARRHDMRTFEVMREQWDTLRVDPSMRWTVEARIPKSQLREARGFRGAAAGGILGTAVVILNAATCRNDHAEGPGCQIVLILTPAAAGVGALLGRLAGEALPVREWQPVSVVR
jgi:hypothetical protein